MQNFFFFFLIFFLLLSGPWSSWLSRKTKIFFLDSFDEHKSWVLRVLNWLNDFDLKLRLEKCKFLQASVLYLGHIISEQGVETDLEKNQCPKDLGSAQNVERG